MCPVTGVFPQTMPTYGQLLLLILPVFALVAVGVVLRRRHWVEGPAEASLLRLVVAVCYPCLIFDAVVGNAAMRAPGNVWLPPLAGFLLAVGGIAVAAVGSAIVATLILDTSPLWGLFWGALTAIAAGGGDLLESTIKRAARTDAASALIPGHGGVLDRIDSLLLALPVALIASLTLGV